MGFFIALMGCGFLGLLFRFLPANRVRNIALWMQVAFVVLMTTGAQIARTFAGLLPSVNIATSTALPLNWFVALASIADDGKIAFVPGPAVVSMLGCAVFIALGIQSLSKGYLSRVHSLLRGGPSRRRARASILGGAIRALTGQPSGRGAFAFVYAMAKTDWQFRRTVLPILIQLVALPVIFMVRTGIGHSPFEPGPPTAPQLLPHLAGLMGFIFCFAITSSNQHRAAWVFLTFPLDGIHSFVRGIFWAFWIPLNLLALLMTPIGIWRWGIADAALFTLYSLAIGSFYLSVELFTISGLPFGNPPEAMRGSMTGPLIFVALVGALILVGLQWFFVFRSRLITAGAVFVFAGAAYAIAQTSLRYLEVNVLHNLHRIAAGNSAMFKEIG
jgi:hypothetical protein